ncbi:hypothetical protein BgiMline_024810 [Biomphalaria glabrata]|nr:Hermansky-Pudlak syndrome 5 protein-like [Biomphalaria glabrata]
MAKTGGLTHILAELSPLDELTVLVTRSTRLKYTCVTVSRKYIALGSNTGGVYIFSRDTLKYLQVVFADTESSQVVCVSLSPSDQHIGFALSTGQVAVYELNIEKRTKPERVRLTQEHVGNVVKCFAWDSLSSKLFVGDDAGKLSIVFVPSIKGKTLFSGPSEVIAYLNVSIYQMEWWNDKLLVSTFTHTHLFDNIRHNYSTIGTKSREGDFGSCFFFEPSTQVPVIYCARPGSRMWEVDFAGKVLHTHQFKQLLASPPIPVIQLVNDQVDGIANVKSASQSVNFFKMFRIGQFIVTWSVKGIYVFDPINVKVVVWTESVKGIKDLCVVNNDLYIFLDISRIQKLTLLPIYQLFTILSTRKKWALMSSLLLSADQISIRPAIMKRVKQDLLQTLIAGLKEEGTADKAEKVLASMEDLSESSIDSLGLFDDFMDSAEVLGHTYLPSGMVVVSEGVQIRGMSPKSVDLSPDSLTKSDDRTEPLRSNEEFGVLYTESVESLSTDRESDVIYNNGHEGNNSLYQKSDIIETDSDVTGEPNGNRRSVSVNSVGSESDDIVSLTKMIRLDSNDNVKSLAELLENNNLSNQEVPTAEVKDVPVVKLDVATTSEFNDVLTAELENVPNSEIAKQDKICESLTDDSSTLESNETFISPSYNENSDIIQDAVKNTNNEAVNDELNAKSNIVDGRQGLNISFPLSGTQIELASETEALTVNIDSTVKAHSIDAADLNIIIDNEQLLKVVHDSTEDSIKQNQTTEALLSPCSYETTLADVSLESHVQPNQQESVLIEKNRSRTSVPIKDNLQETKTNTSVKEKSKLSNRYAHVDLFSGMDNLIAQPVRTGRKKRKALSERKVQSSSLGYHRGTVSLGDEQDELQENNLDTISIGTISSLDEDDDDVILPGGMTPDSLSSAGDVSSEQGNTKSSLEYSISPPLFKDKPIRKSSAPFPFSNEKIEAIPPLIDRLAAARGTYLSDESPPSLSPLSGSGEHNSSVIVGSPRASLSAFTDSLSHFKSHTKSFIKTIKEKNILMSKSSSSPMLSALTNLQSSPASHIQNVTHDTLNAMVQPDNASQILEKSSLKPEDEVAASLDLAALTRVARDVKKKLSEPATLLKPKLTLRILNEWARELNGLLLEYHRGLFEKKQRDIPSPSNDTSNIKNQRVELKESDESSDERMFELSSSVEIDDNSQKESEARISQTSTTDIKTSELKKLATTNIEPSYWAGINHSKDPFHLTSEDLETIKSLTTLCFTTGATGSILNFFSLSDKASVYELVKSILPQHVLSSLTHTSTTHFAPHRPSSFNSSETSQDRHNSQASEIRLQEDIRAENLNQCDSETRSNRSCDNVVDQMSLTLDSGLVTNSVCDNVQSIQEHVYQNVTIQHDLSLALFTRLYFFALDYDRIKLELNKHREKLFLTWISALHCSLDVGQGDIVSSLLLDKQINSALDYLRSGILPRQSAYLGHIYRLFDMAPSKTSEFCGEVNKKVSYTDLLNLCTLCNKPPGDFIMKYIKQQMSSLTHYHRKAAFLQICEDRDLRYLLLESLLPQLSHDVPQADSSEIVASQVIAVLPFDWLNLLLPFIHSDDEIEDIVNLSIRISYWPVTIKLLTKSNQWERLLKIIVDIGEIKFLKGKHGEDAYIPQTLDQWRYLLKVYVAKQTKETLTNQMQPSKAEVKSLNTNDSSNSENLPLDGANVVGENSDDNSEAANTGTNYESFSRSDSCQWEAITWSSLGYRLLSNIGGALTLDLLMEHLHDQQMAQDCLSTEFLYACLMDYKIRLQQDHVVHEMLEKLSAYMWTKKPGFVPPSVFYAINREKTLVEKGGDDTVALHSLFSHVQSLDSHKLMSEHLGGHWGVDVDISSPCLVCNVPLKYVMSLSEQGVIVFPCTHAFHRCCIKSPVCPILH